MSAKLEAFMNETNAGEIQNRRPSKLSLGYYLDTFGKNKVRPDKDDLELQIGPGKDDPGIPTLYSYLNEKNLTMKELIGYQEKYGKDDTEITHIQRKTSQNDKDSNFEGFGWITGVLIRTILCIFGATLFLRMSWIAGQAGLVLGLGIVLLSLVIVGITAISMSAIATNGEIRSGGLYYIVSRSLGPEFGGSIGVIFYLANIGNAAMNIVGLSEAIVSILSDNNLKLIDGDIHDIRIYSLAICIILQTIIFIGTKFETRTQFAFMITIVISLVSHFVGTFFPNDYQRERGVIGYSPHVLYHNLWPDFRNSESFITVFGIYFPAMTGIMGGANMSGDLKNPSKAIPKGTIPAIIITTLTYAITMIITSATTVSDATGFSIPQFDNLTGDFIHPPCRRNNSCAFGINNDYELMILQGAWPPLIIAGIVATTLSSASGCMIGAPRVLQALSSDKLFPFLNYFAKGHGKNNEPYRAYFMTFFISVSIISIGRFNTIAELITNFFLAAFAIMNFACFDASAARSPGFRPGFSLYNKNLSLFGAVLCIIMMFVYSWSMSLLVLGVYVALYSYIKNRKSQVDWGSSTQANRYRQALSNVLKLNHKTEHVKNYRPQILVLSGNPAARQVLVDFAYCITKGTSLLVCGHVIPYPSSVAVTSIIEKLRKRYTQWLYEHRIKAFYSAVAQTSLRAGVQNLLQTVGLGKMQPNILMIGYKDTWLTQIEEGRSEDLKDYWGVISDAFESNLSICIFRNGNEGLDTSGYITDETDKLFLKLPQMTVNKFSPLADDLTKGIKKKRHRPKATNMHRDLSKGSMKHDNMVSEVLNNVLHKHASENMYNQDSTQYKINAKFRHRIKDGLVDVWWLYDDGGLTWLLAYLLTTHPSFEAKLRVFTTCPSNIEPETVQDNVEKMLNKFRITFKQVIVIVYEDRDLYPETQDEYNEVMEVINKNPDNPGIPSQILDENANRTKKFLLMREYLLEHSSASDLVIMTLPVAYTEIVISPLYMLWLEMLSRDMPPMLFVRGNHTSVMTYYS